MAVVARSERLYLASVPPWGAARVSAKCSSTRRRPLPPSPPPTLSRADHEPHPYALRVEHIRFDLVQKVGAPGAAEAPVDAHRGERAAHGRYVVALGEPLPSRATQRRERRLVEEPRIGACQHRWAAAVAAVELGAQLRGQVALPHRHRPGDPHDPLLGRASFAEEGDHGRGDGGVRGGGTRGGSQVAVAHGRRIRGPNLRGG